MQNNEELMKQHLNEIKCKKEQTFKEKYPEDYEYLNKKYIFKKFMQYNNKCKICNDFCLGEFCTSCKKTDEYKKIHYELDKEEYNRRMNKEFNEEFIRNNFIYFDEIKKKNLFNNIDFIKYFPMHESNMYAIKKRFNIQEDNKTKIFGKLETEFIEKLSKK